MATQTQLDSVLNDPMRIKTIRALALFDSPSEEAFDRLTRLASRIVHAPVSLVSLVDNKRQWFKSIVGLPEPWRSQRQTPLSHSFCQHVVATNKPLVVSDSRQVDFLKDNMAIPDLNVIAYLGMPLTTKDGYGLGSFCVIDGVPRDWTEDEIAMLEDLAAITMALIDMRAEMIDMQKLGQSKLEARTNELKEVRARAGDDYRDVLEKVVTLLANHQPPELITSFILSTPQYSIRR
ncbi:MAG: GAF domain-containing protein [Chloroflexota bacterium]|nr:GAF domain-containing protein [Chloroflexota bacterium]